MSSPPLPFVTPEEYLAAERKAERRSEYLNGEVFAMAGASRRHVQISGNLIAALKNELKGRDCDVYATELRVRVNPKGNYLYAYPDVSVVCGESQFEDERFDTLLNPKVIIEILSPSTEPFDRGKKFTLYRQIDSLAEYLLMAQDETRVEQYVRQPGGDWVLSERTGLDDAVTLPSLGLSLKLFDIYYRVSF
jgi:Uma2 family endonuclease